MSAIRAVVKFTFEQATKAQGGVEVYLYSFFNLSARWGWVVNATPQPIYSRERDPVPIVQEAEWAAGPVWTVAENLAYTEKKKLKFHKNTSSGSRLVQCERTDMTNLIVAFRSFAKSD